MKLSELAREVPGAVLEGPDVEIDDLSHDSRRVGPGGLFVALPGRNADGLRFVAAAAQNGAAAIAASFDAQVSVDLPVLRLRTPRRDLAILAASVHGRPADALTLIGLTGTNGKTTVTTLIARIIEAAGGSPGLVGTVEHRIGAVSRPARHTTPEAPTVHRLLREMVDAGVEVAAMEFSSIGLAERRVDEVKVSAAGFLNLTADHLDYHTDMAEYGAAKARLFTEHLRPGAISVIDTHGTFGARLADAIDGPVWRIGKDLDVEWTALTLTAGGLVGTLKTPRGVLQIQSPLVGAFNADNVAMAASLALAVDLPSAAVCRGLQTAVVRGRMESVANEIGVSVLVDYAHSPDALGRAIEAVSPLTEGAVWVIFGCGGDRDRAKREPMGRAAAAADAVIVTTDNPRTEAPAAIAEEALRGVLGGGRTRCAAPSPDGVWVELDRRQAIEQTLAAAAPGDTVLIAGKGHETYQEIAGERQPFDDVQIARQALAQRGISTAHLLAVPDAERIAGQQAEVGSVSIDTRTLEAGAAFFCLRGPHFDGHQFAAQAAEKGATVIVAEADAIGQLPAELRDGRILLIAVPDTTRALGQAAAAHAATFDVRVVGLTGSSGKTTTKELVAAVLEATVGGATGVLKTAGNLNNHLGVPLTLFRLRPRHRFAVVEMGMSALGEIRALAELAKPEVGVVTTVGAAHLEGLGTLDNVAAAKGELLAALPADGRGIFPSSIAHRGTLTAGLEAAAFTIGEAADDALRLSALNATATGVDANLTLGTKTVRLSLEFGGRYSLFNAALAVAVGLHFGADLDACVEALAHVPAPALRGEMRTLPDGSVVTLDCYNANPQSMAAAVGSFVERASDAVLVLGDMLELGASAETAHRALGRRIAEQARHTDLDLIAVGSLGAYIGKGALDAGMAPGRVVLAADIEAARRAVARRPLRPVLLKASRGLRLERLYAALAGRGES